MTSLWEDYPAMRDSCNHLVMALQQSPSTPALVVRKLPCCWRPRDGFTLEDEDRTIACDGRAPRAAFGSILEAVPDGAHEITFVVYGWNSVVGVAVAAEGGLQVWVGMVSKVRSTRSLLLRLKAA